LVWMPAQARGSCSVRMAWRELLMQRIRFQQR
jgi:hypothetical protein